VLVDWDGVRYSEKLSKAPRKRESKASMQKEASQRKRYPLLPSEIEISKPSILIDKHGVILAWYLPGIVKESSILLQ
jgi:hypothetical protein